MRRDGWCWQKGRDLRADGIEAGLPWRLETFLIDAPWEESTVTGTLLS